LRLVTYDRRGHRRLGAILDGEVVDLPDAVGHPAFPSTMEALVASNGGTVLDAARAALDRDEAEACVVRDARPLVPLMPSTLRSLDAEEGTRRILGPDDEVPWPEGAGWLDYVPKVAAVLGRPGVHLDVDSARYLVFGYTLVNDFFALDANGDPTPIGEGLPVALGPCIVTADEVDPQTMVVTVDVDGEQWSKGNLNGVATSLFRVISQSSKIEGLSSGDTFASSPFGGFHGEPGRHLWPGATVELHAEAIGTLRNRLGPRP
jgi:2-keto-4-pentenoate hydratase/2-oxohepta-3-ene-1,7-dioic acid hydratase in catechol pathway